MLVLHRGHSANISSLFHTCSKQDPCYYCLHAYHFIGFICLSLLARVAIGFVGLSSGLKYFSLFGQARIGASVKKKIARSKNASKGRKSLRKRLLPAG